MHADTEGAEKKRAPLRVGWVYAESKSDVPAKTLWRAGAACQE